MCDTCVCVCVCVCVCTCVCACMHAGSVDEVLLTPCYLQVDGDGAQLVMQVSGLEEDEERVLLDALTSNNDIASGLQRLGVTKVPLSPFSV